MITQNMITENLKNLLNESHNPVRVSFTKINGTIRNIECTTNLDLIPVEFHPKQKEPTAISNDKVVRVYDLENEGWRSFRFDNVLSFDLIA